MSGYSSQRRPENDDFEDGDEEYDDEENVELETGFQTVVVIDNIPVVDKDRIERLTTVISKYATQMGTIVEGGLILPQGEDGKSKGFAIVEYDEARSADRAVADLDGLALDKNHKLRVVRLSDYLKLDSVSNVYEPPAPKVFQPKEELTSWLMDDRTLHCTDQFVIRQGDLTSVYWNGIKDGQPQPELEISRPKWTDTYVQWSPLGSYLVTLHKQGIVIWGGPSWSRIQRFNHPGVSIVEFSPKEGYIITFSPQFEEHDDPKNPKCIMVWDVTTGQMMRSFTARPGTSKEGPPPPFRWSHDDKYFARVGENAISIYETPSMGLLDKNSVKINGVRDIAWSPTQNLLAFFVPESGNVAAKVSILDVPSKREVRQKNLFNVSNVKMHWQSEGVYLAVKVDRHAKNKKSTYVNFELFRIKEKDIPIELLELKDNVHAFAWEPAASRFAIIHGENPLKPDVSFYTMGMASGGVSAKVKLLKTLEKKTCNSLFWSPKGNHIILAGLRNMAGQLEFFNVETLETMGNDEHANCTGVDWDPTGRYVATSISHWRVQMDTGYRLYTFSGKNLTKVLRDRFFQFLWRPRPPSFLTKEKEADIKKNLKSYSKMYDMEDETQKKKDREEIDKQLAMKLQEFHGRLQDREREYKSKHAERAKLRGGRESDDEGDYEEVEEWVEELIEQTVEVIEDDDDNGK
eukprot:TRINITY_DN1393_c0_g1_i1.p1 TRINITY_DN1393_c0_g1~~TRINITY_DN1393_c0_g1_i1.p1  ORF type:complete len:726 (-),score=245.42 TRINITY_DN1393_c0_g1_i1:13-2079(-)